MVNLIQVDKSGGDIFEKDYSIMVVVNKNKVYGINIPQKIKDDLISEYKRGNLNINSQSEKKQKNRFRLRFHISIVIQLIMEALGKMDIKRDVNLQICNDFDGHFHEIKDMIFGHLKEKIKDLKREDIIQARFPKSSLIDISGKNIRNRKEVKDYNLVKLNSKDLIKIIRK